MPSSVMAGMVSVITVVAVEVEVAWESWEIKGWEIWVRWEGDCQNSEMELVCLEERLGDRTNRLDHARRRCGACASWITKAAWKPRRLGLQFQGPKRRFR